MGEIAVVGGGLMGHGIALVLALAGHGVRITDTQPETRARVPALMDSALATLREAGAAPEGWDSERLARAVRVEAELEAAVDGAGLVIEAIIEKPEAKRALFERTRPAARGRGDPRQQHQLPRRLPADPGGRQSRALIAALVHAALYRRPRRRRARARRRDPAVVDGDGRPRTRPGPGRSC